MMLTIERCIHLHRHRPVRFLRDPGGMVIAGFAWGIMVLSACALWVSVSCWLGIWSFFGILETTVLTVSVAMCMWTHYMVMTTEPGFVPKNESTANDTIKPRRDHDARSASESDSDDSADVEMPLEEFENLEDDGSLLVFCDECNTYRPTRAMHCDTCERCVVLMDHHCPWVNNCVGIGNQRFFLLFLAYVVVSSVHVLMLILLQRWTCDSDGDMACGFQAGQFPGRLGIWLLAASCVFGLFCAVMLGMEIHSIYEDPLYSNISKKLNVRTGCKSSSRLERHLSVVFGTNGFEFTWLWPLPQRRNRQDWEIIGGFAPSVDDGGLC